MHKLSILFVVFGLTAALNTLAFDKTDKKIDDCIASNSGADSIICLEDMLRDTDAEWNSLEKKIIASLERKLKSQDLTATHFSAALASFKQSHNDFEKFRETACNFVAYSSGAVASGYQQHLLGCMNRKTRAHIDWLKTHFFRE